MTAPDRLPKPYLVRTAVDDILANLDEGDAVPPERELAVRLAWPSSARSTCGSRHAR